MKKAFAILLSVITVISTAFLSSCNKETVDDITIPIDYVESTTFVSKEISNNNLSLEETSVTSNKSQNDIGGGTLGLLKYRMNYYDIAEPFGNLVRDEEFNEWANVVYLENPNETNVMVMKRFVQDFNISRQDFDKANIEWAKIIVEGLHDEPVIDPQDFANQETQEIYNGDIIYTFNDEIINEYYLSHDYPYVYESEYEKAVEEGSYSTRTHWIDIEQMIADYEEKYGVKYESSESTTAVSAAEVTEETTETTTEALTSIE